MTNEINEIGEHVIVLYESDNYNTIAYVSYDGETINLVEEDKVSGEKNEVLLVKIELIELAKAIKSMKLGK